MDKYFRTESGTVALGRRHVCVRCDETINHGTGVVQMWKGTEDLRISPGCAKVLGEWRPECFRLEFELNPQQRDYSCDQCGGFIGPREAYRCFVLGTETDEDHYYAERRGKVLYNVQHHPDCR